MPEEISSIIWDTLIAKLPHASIYGKYFVICYISSQRTRLPANSSNNKALILKSKVFRPFQRTKVLIIAGVSLYESLRISSTVKSTIVQNEEQWIACSSCHLAFSSEAEFLIHSKNNHPDRKVKATKIDTY